MIVPPDITNAKNGFEYNLGQTRIHKNRFFLYIFPFFFNLFLFLPFPLQATIGEWKNIMTKTVFLRTFNHYTFQFVCFCFSLSVPRDSFPVRETFLGLCPVLNFYFSPLLLWYRSTGSLFGLLTELYCLSIINTNPTSQTSKWSKFFTCCCVPSGAHSFYGLVVYGFIKTTFLPGFCLTEFFTLYLFI